MCVLRRRQSLRRHGRFDLWDLRHVQFWEVFTIRGGSLHKLLTWLLHGDFRVDCLQQLSRWNIIGNHRGTVLSTMRRLYCW